ncbi:MAG: stage II sporulation protein D [Clostridium sp.]|nr:stage II sporulation protein D [Clostridium sp.]
MVKKFFIALFAMIVFIFSMSIFIGGFSTNGQNVYNKKDYNIKPNDIVFNNDKDDQYNVSVYITKQKIIKKLNIEEYTRGVVACEMPADFNIEALKAQAVAARTYAASHMEAYKGEKSNKANGADVTDDVSCQVYETKDERINSWPSNVAGEYWNKITKAVESTKGEILTYDGKLVMEPLYFAVSSGKTEDSKEVIGDYQPYLKSVSSSGENMAYKYKTKVCFNFVTFLDKINQYYKNTNLNLGNIRSSVNILSRTGAGGVKEIKVGNETISGVKFRKIIGANSTNFTIKYDSSLIEFDCTGYGHDVGMSQWGANILAKNGQKYEDILCHYYTGTKVTKINDQ